MKHTANILSAARIALSAALLFLGGHTVWFVAVYAACGASDVLDGYIARKTRTESVFGARLDSAADAVMYGVIVVFMFTHATETVMRLLPLVAAVAAVRAVNILYAKYKYRTFASLHTWGNKLTGFCVFLTPVIFVLTRRADVIAYVCVLSVLAALEECAVHLTSDRLALDRKSIFVSSENAKIC